MNISSKFLKTNRAQLVNKNTNTLISNINSSIYPSLSDANLTQTNNNNKYQHLYNIANEMQNKGGLQKQAIHTLFKELTGLKKINKNTFADDFANAVTSYTNRSVDFDKAKGLYASLILNPNLANYLPSGINNSLIGRFNSIDRSFLLESLKKVERKYTKRKIIKYTSIGAGTGVACGVLTGVAFPVILPTTAFVGGIYGAGIGYFAGSSVAKCRLNDSYANNSYTNNFYAKELPSTNKISDFVKIIFHQFSKKNSRFFRESRHNNQPSTSTSLPPVSLFGTPRTRDYNNNSQIHTNTPIYESYNTASTAFYATTNKPLPSRPPLPNSPLSKPMHILPVDTPTTAAGYGYSDEKKGILGRGVSSSVPYNTQAMEEYLSKMGATATKGQRQEGYDADILHPNYLARIKE